MLYIIFNHDGSIKTLIVGESIQQGDHLTKQIFAKVEGYSISDYTCQGNFVLPTGEISSLVASADVDEEFGDGYSITLTEAQTLYAGNIKLNLKLVNLQNQILCSYQVTLVINPTSYDPSEVNITNAQYNSLIQSLNSYALKTKSIPIIEVLSDDTFEEIKDKAYGDKFFAFENPVDNRVLIGCFNSTTNFAAFNGEKLKVGAITDETTFAEWDSEYSYESYVYQSEVSIPSVAGKIVKRDENGAIKAAALNINGLIDIYDTNGNYISVDARGLIFNGKLLADAEGVIALTSDSGTLSVEQQEKLNNPYCYIRYEQFGSYAYYLKWTENSNYIYFYRIDTSATPNVIDLKREYFRITKSDYSYSLSSQEYKTYNKDSLDTQFAAKANITYVDDAIQNVREVAEGKTQRIVIHNNVTLADLKTFINDYSGHVYDLEGNDITQNVIDGDYDNNTVINNLFQSTNDEITTQQVAPFYSIIIAQFKKWETSSDYGQKPILISVSELNKGDVVYVYETNVPDRWFTTTGTEYNAKFAALEAKTNLNNYVDLTSVQTISGEKTFRNTITTQNVEPVYDISFSLGSNDKRYNTVYTVALGTGSSIIAVSNIAEKDDIKTLNGVSLLGGGNIAYDSALSDSSTNAVQNKVLKGIVDDLSNRLTILEESIIADEILSYTYLTQSAIPTNVSSYPIIESAGMNNTDIKGNSVVYNQLAPHTTYTSLGITQTYDSETGVFTLSGTSSSVYCNTYPTEFPSSLLDNKVLLIMKLIANPNNVSKISFGFLNQSNSGVDSNGVIGIYTKIFTLSSSYLRGQGFSLNNGVDYTGVKVMVKYCNLTKMFPTNTPTTTDDPRVQWAIQYALANPSYNSGTLVNSKPTALVSHGFNIWDEEMTVVTNHLETSNFTKVVPNQNYYIKSSTTIGNRWNWYDKDKNLISTVNVGANYVITVPSNAYFFKFSLASAYGTTYKNDICINISNASLNGTYRPYKAPITYPLTLPVLRSAGSVQDDTKKVKIGVVDLGTLNWTYSAGANNSWYSNQLTGAKLPPNNSAKANIFCSNYVSKSQANVVNETTNGIGLHQNGRIWCKNGSSTTQPTGILNYELATPTDQPEITLPENIEFEKGGSLEVVYDSTDKTPSDFDFEVAVYKPIE